MSGGDCIFIPNSVYFEPGSENYALGKVLLERYRSLAVPCIPIESHNNIEVMRKSPNSAFPKMKQNLIIGIRKTHKYVPNCKTSDFLVPYTSSGCSAMCLYCYLVCNYNKCSYLRLFVNREQMMDKLVQTADKSEKSLTFEIGSNSDLVLENTITGNLEWTIKEFGKSQKGFLTLPTKFDSIDPLLNLPHNGKTIIRMSVNPQEIIRKVELGTSGLDSRIMAVNKLADSGYPVGILIAPVVMLENWKALYAQLIEKLSKDLSEQVRREAFFEIIFMTYSYIHRMINSEAFPKAVELYSPEMMTGRGMGKYMYKLKLREEGERFLRETMKQYLPTSTICYIV